MRACIYEMPGLAEEFASSQPRATQSVIILAAGALDTIPVARPMLVSVSSKAYKVFQPAHV